MTSRFSSIFEVFYYAKLLIGFKIHTQLKAAGDANTSCAEALFNKLKLNKARYGKADTYDQLLSVINDIE